MDPYDDLSQFFRARKEVACLDLELLVIASKATGLTAGVRRAKLRDNGTRCKAVRREPLSIEHNAQRPGLPADDRSLGNVIQLLQRVFQFCRNAPQLVSIVILAPER